MLASNTSTLVAFSVYPALDACLVGFALLGHAAWDAVVPSWTSWLARPFS